MSIGNFYQYLMTAWSEKQWREEASMYVKKNNNLKTFVTSVILGTGRIWQAEVSYLRARELIL